MSNFFLCNCLEHVLSHVPPNMIMYQKHIIIRMILSHLLLKLINLVDIH